MLLKVQSCVPLTKTFVATIAAAIAIHQWNDNGHDPDQSKIEWNSGDAVSYSPFLFC